MYAGPILWAVGLSAIMTRGVTIRRQSAGISFRQPEPSCVPLAVQGLEMSNLFPEKRSHWLGFRRLASQHDIDLILTLAWRFLDDEDDPWTARLNQFQNGKRESVKAAGRVLTVAAENLGLRGKKGIVVGTPSARSDRLSSNGGMFSLGQAIAEGFGWEWCPGLVSRQVRRDTPSEADGAPYTAGRISGVDYVVVVDDFVLEGDTLSDVARAVKAANPSIVVIGLALGRNVLKTYAEAHGVKLTNNHIPREWLELWDHPTH